MAKIKDVAKETGLAVSTVSRILNNRGYISDEARQKVAEAVKKLNYQPNEAARSLHGRNTNVIGVIVPHIRHPFFAEFISYLEYYASEKGYIILLYNSKNVQEKEEKYIKVCMQSNVAGIILCTDSESLGGFRKAPFPVITMEYLPDNSTSSVECDNNQGGALAAEKLISRGCRNLLYLYSDDTMHILAEHRKAGFKRVCKEQNVSYSDYMLEDGYSMFCEAKYNYGIENALRRYPNTDGILACSDIIAAQALHVCHKLHIAVPEQLKIIGFGDVSLAYMTMPQLTTIHQPAKEMAEMAVTLICEFVSGKMISKRMVFSVHLVERGTT